jgi:hypothetical protein
LSKDPTVLQLMRFASLVSYWIFCVLFVCCIKQSLWTYNVFYFHTETNFIYTRQIQSNNRVFTTDKVVWLTWGWTCVRIAHIPCSELWNNIIFSDFWMMYFALFWSIVWRKDCDFSYYDYAASTWDTTEVNIWNDWQFTRDFRLHTVVLSRWLLQDLEKFCVMQVLHA